MRKFLSRIKMLFTFIFKDCGLSCARRELRRIGAFDIVSTTDAPKPSDLLMVYNLTEDSVYMVKFNKYKRKGKFNAGEDTQLVYFLPQAGSNLYKVMNCRARPDVILKNATKAEFVTFSSRLTDAFFYDYPLGGLFIDKKDNHLMMIMEKVGNSSIVFDLDSLPLYRVTHFHQFSHIIDTSYITSNYDIRPMAPNTLLAILSRNWSKVAFRFYTERLVDIIKRSEEEHFHCKLYSKGLTFCCNEPPTKQHKEPIKELSK